MNTSIELPDKLNDKHKDLIKMMIDSGLSYILSRGCERHSMEEEDIYVCIKLAERIKRNIDLI